MPKRTFVRHADYDYDTGNIYDPNRRTDRGIMALYDDHDIIIHSTTKRAVQTARKISDAKKLPMIHTSVLQDGYFNKYLPQQLEEVISRHDTINPLLISHLPIIGGFLEYYQKLFGVKTKSIGLANLTGFSVDTIEQTLYTVPGNSIIRSERINYFNTTDDEDDLPF